MGGIPWSLLNTTLDYSFNNNKKKKSKRNYLKFCRWPLNDKNGLLPINEELGIYLVLSFYGMFDVVGSCLVNEKKTEKEGLPLF